MVLNIKEIIKKYIVYPINFQDHPFHLVDPSPWPIIGGFGAFFSVTGGVLAIHGYKGGSILVGLGFFTIIYVIFSWWRDISREGTFEGQHTSWVQLGLRFGIILFIASEVMFFFAFFWAFFWSSLAPVPEIGSIWPPQGIECFSSFGIPFLNTLIRRSSGASCTWAHHAIVCGDAVGAKNALIATLVLAVAFTGFQLYEYNHASFTISDGIYGSTFYLATGFHGFHVFIGTCFLTVCLFRLLGTQFTRQHHFGFEAAAWYWDFVDVVWLFLFIFIYYWGGS